MIYQSCMRCGKVLKPGSLKYLVNIKVVADFDGIINESDNNSEEMITEILNEIEEIEAEELERDVYEEFNLVLCKVCKDLFVSNPLNHNEDDLSYFDPDATPPIH